MEALNSLGENKLPSFFLSMPNGIFAGLWNHDSILDKWAWEEVSRSKTLGGYDDDGKPKIPGT